MYVCGNIFFFLLPPFVARALEHRKCGDDKVLITYYDFGLLFNMMSTKLVGFSFLVSFFFSFELFSFLFLELFFLSELKLSCICNDSEYFQT